MGAAPRARVHARRHSGLHTSIHTHSRTQKHTQAHVYAHTHARTHAIRAYKQTRKPVRIVLVVSWSGLTLGLRSRRPQGRERGAQEKKKAYSTRYSQAVSHPSTNQARPCLASEIRRDRARSGWYGRRRRRAVAVVPKSLLLLQHWPAILHASPHTCPHVPTPPRTKDGRADGRTNG